MVDIFDIYFAKIYVVLFLLAIVLSPPSINGFLLPLWYLQSLLIKLYQQNLYNEKNKDKNKNKNKQKNKNKHLFEWFLSPTYSLFEQVNCIDWVSYCYILSLAEIYICLVPLYLLSVGNLIVNPVHFLLSENIKRGNQCIIKQFYYLIPNINIIILICFFPAG